MQCTSWTKQIIWLLAKWFVYHLCLSWKILKSLSQMQYPMFYPLHCPVDSFLSLWIMKIRVVSHMHSSGQRLYNSVIRRWQTDLEAGSNACSEVPTSGVVVQLLVASISCVTCSLWTGLLKTIAHKVSIAVNGYDVWVVMLIFCVLVLVATTFISHTVGAMVILPIVQTVGSELPVRLSSLWPPSINSNMHSRAPAYSDLMVQLIM